MKRLIELVTKYKYLVALLSVFNFLLTPVHVSIFQSLTAEIVVINYSLVILAGSLIAVNIKTKLRSYILGALTLVFIWLEFSNPENHLIESLRLASSFLLFLYFFYLLVSQLRSIGQINLQFIIGPILGFVYLGVIGGILFETLYLINSSSFHLQSTSITGYIFYYFSFISITTVGYGDVAPATPPAQAITLILNIIGQFYLAIVIAVFVGKYINKPK